MPSGHDIQVKDVDAIHGFNGKFGDFLEAMTVDLKKMIDSLQRIQDEVESKARDANEQYEQSRCEARIARNEWQNLMSQSERDPRAVTECRMRLDHMEGHVKPMMQGYAGMAQSFAAQAKRDIGQMTEITRRYRTKLESMVENGRKFLEMAEDRVRNYKETQMGGN